MAPRSMTDTPEILLLDPGPLAGVPMLFVQEGMCRTLLIENADPMLSRCCGEPVPEGVDLCGCHAQ